MTAPAPEQPDFRLLVVFDLDETVVHTLPERRDTPCRVHRLEGHTVIERPYVSEMLRALAPVCTLAIWTVGTSDYAEFVAERVFRPHCDLAFVYSRDRCTRRFDPATSMDYDVKDLKKVFRRGFPRERVLMVDDTPRKLERHYGNLVTVREFLGEPEDDELPHLTQFLLSFAEVPDVRRIEKRGWRRAARAE